MTLFDDRRAAGRELATRLERYGSDALVLALPRGGVPVGFEVARALGAPLDVFVVRKLGAPGREELALGAIASGGSRVINDDVVRGLGVPQHRIEAIAERERRELERRERLYRGERGPPAVADRTVILVDDGLATGASMRAAVRALRQLGPARLVAAVPTAAPESCAELAPEVDELVCAATPRPFYGVGMWYGSFPQVSDDEVRALLDEAAARFERGASTGGADRSR